MMHPLYDPSKLTDDEILDRLGKAYNYLSQQNALGHAYTADNIQQTIMALETEKEVRFQKMMTDEFNKTNPNELDPIVLGTLEDEQDTQ